MAAPTITSFSPGEDTDMNGNVTIYGTNFENPDVTHVELIKGLIHIEIGTFDIVNTTSLTFAPGSQAPGSYTLRVINSDGHADSGSQWINSEDGLHRP